MFGITRLSFNFLTGAPFITALVLILFILLAIYLYRRTNPPLPMGVRIVLAGLRIAAVIALFLALFEPVMSYRREYDRTPKLSILIDRSKSMDLSESGKTRAERVDSLLSSASFMSFASNFDVNKRTFAAGLMNNETGSDRDRTAIGEALTELSQEDVTEPSEYWLLFSDGISNSGVAPAEAAARVKSPVYSIGLGIPSTEKDIGITGLDYNQVVFAGKPTEMKVHLQWSGMNNDKARLEVKSGERALQSKAVDLPSGDLKQEETISFTPERPGQQTFQVSIPKLENEVNGDNNSRSFSMTVLKSKLKVLLIADHLDWEYAFLNRYLLNAENVDLTTVVSKKGGGYLGQGFPARQEELNQYDLIILYDIDLQALNAKTEMFKSFLTDKGGGIFAVLGENYVKSPYPRWIDDYLPFIARSRVGRLVCVKFSGRPVENYLFHPAVRLSESRQGIRDAWGNLPPFEAMVPVDSVTPGSEILATAGIGSGGAEVPILGYRTIGAGKILAVSAVPFWHWAFFSYGFGGQGTEYKNFFGGIVNWLAIKEESEPIKITPDKTVYTRGEKVGFTGSVYDLGFRPIAGASGYVALVDEAGHDTTISQLTEKGEGKYRAEFETVPAGRYKYSGVVEKDGKKLKESSGQIAIETFSIEEYQRQPDLTTLAQISHLTGGDFYPLSEADSLYTRLKSDKIAVRVQKEIVLWNKFWLLTVFIAALGTEWLLRKRYQLI